MPHWGKDVLNKGFTLIEALLAIFFLGFGMLTLLSFLISIGMIEEETTRKAYAAFSAQEKMEEMKFRIRTATLLTQQGDEVMDKPYGPLWRSWKVYSYVKIEGVKEIEVQCHYVWKGKKKGVTLKSLIVP